MKYTMITVGSTGDVLPYVQLGKELKRRGNEVKICAFSDFEKMIEGEGLEFAPLAGDARDLMSKLMSPGTSGIGFLSQVKEGLQPIIWPLLDSMEAACEGSDAIISTFLGRIPYSLAEMYGVPFVQTHFFPMDLAAGMPVTTAPGPQNNWVYNLMTYPLAYLLMNTIESYYLGDWRRERGLPAWKISSRPAYELDGHTVPVLYAVSPAVLPRSLLWGDNIYITGYWVDKRKPRYAPSAELKKFMAAGGKPVYIGFGSMTSGDMGETLGIVLDAIAESGVRAVISKGWGEMEIPKRENVCVVGDVPHSWLFERVAAVVHHGGAGTTASGILACRPTLVIPFGGDQPFWGARVYELGLGPKPIRREKLTVERLSRALADLTSTKSYEKVAKKIGKQVGREDGKVLAADIIEREVGNWLIKLG